MGMLFSSLRDEEPDGFGSMFGPKMGTWSVSSKKDPRWNRSGRGYGLVMSGGPGEAGDWIKECDAKYGERPDDLSMSFYKD